MIDYKLIGSRIKLFRKQRGYTQEQLALTICTSTAYISNIEHAIKKPSLQKLEQIADALGITINDLISPDYYNGNIADFIPDFLDQCSSWEKRQLLKNLNNIIQIIESKN